MLPNGEKKYECIVSTDPYDPRLPMGMGREMLTNPDCEEERLTLLRIKPKRNDKGHNDIVRGILETRIAGKHTYYSGRCSSRSSLISKRVKKDLEENDGMVIYILKR